jgi:sensor c-di-GMP phosphodiesterase-like protein
MVKAVILLTDDMGMTTTAEGVETSGQSDWLRAGARVSAGCPMAATELPGYLLTYLAGTDAADNATD